MPRSVSYLTVILHNLTGGRIFDGDVTSPAGFLKLTTVGRKTGMARTVELLYIRDGDAYVVTASNAGKPNNPGWLFNLQANPEVTIEVHGVRQSASAEIADPAKRQELWAQLTEIAPMYKGYKTHTQRVVPMVLIRPQSEAKA